MIRKVVMRAAGSGIRLFLATKETPKEMLRVFALDGRGGKFGEALHRTHIRKG